MLPVVQLRMVIYAQDALKLKKWFTKTPEWLSKPRAPITPHSSLHIQMTNVNIMSSFLLHNVIFSLQLSFPFRAYRDYYGSLGGT